MLPAMHAPGPFLLALTIVLGVAAVTTVLFQRLRQPVVLGYILAGLIIGPYVPVPLVADREIVETLSELGIILLMFALGLEFSPRKLVRVGPTAGVTAIVQSSLMVWLGFVVGRALGWTVLESVFTGAMVSMSSTTIIAKAFDELRVRGPLRDLVVAVLLVEDLFAILFMAILTAVATGAGVSPGELGTTLGRLGAFLALLLGCGMLLVPRAIRYVRRRGNPETLLVASLGLCFGFAYLALASGYSIALGAFIAGSLVAESGHAQEVEEVVRPVRDLFAAVFFVSVGMMIDPALMARNWPAVVVLTALVVFGKSAAVGSGALLTGSGVRTSVQAGMSLAQIGEFSFILAALGLSLGATRDFLYPVAVAVSAITTLTTPWLITASGATSDWIERKLPARLQTVISLYGSWVEQLGRSPGRRTLGARIRKVLLAILVDAAAVVAIALGVSLGGPTGIRRISAGSNVDGEIVRWSLLVVATLACVPFLIGLVRNGRRLGLALASTALPEVAAGRPDLAAAPRRVLVAVVQLAATAVVLLPVFALTQILLPAAPAVLVLGTVIVVLGVGFWRSTTDLLGHVRAGAQVIVEALARQGAADGHARPQDGPDAMATIRQMFPGIGEPTALRLPEGSSAVGRTLSALGVRGRTGATVLVISRPGRAVTIPDAHEVLRSGDVLVLAGSGGAVEAARQLLGVEPTPLAAVVPLAERKPQGRAD
jgi:CPA2 family monovalent cation:H+ antiporter-2